MRRTFTTVTNPEFYDALREDAEAGDTNWTVSKHARRGDRLLLYVTSPVQAIVAQGILDEDPVLDEDPSSEWFGHYFAEIHSLRMLDTPIHRTRLLENFPDWGYWKQPRGGVRVPEACIHEMECLMRGESV